jgi:hypothetical protein
MRVNEARKRYGPPVSATEPTASPVTEGHSGLHRPLALLILLATGILSLPVSAAFLDGEDTEKYILPAALVGMALIGALVGSALPGLAGEHAARGKARWVGALVGVVMVVLGTLIFFVILNGFDGA